MKEILFLNPVFKEMIWGGNQLHDKFHYTIPSDHTGECWAISAHPNGDCTVKNGTFAGRQLSELWENEKELFGEAADTLSVFPLLTKIIDAKADLSIQVHPDDAYAKEHENGSLGKTECWYILDCDEDASIVIGHHAADKEELKQMISEKRWNDLIRVIPIKKGDFFQITPGTVHAIKGGTMILETQQSSDITYRLYDYDRLSNGKPRELHLEKSIDVIKCPYVEDNNTRSIERTDSYEKETLIECDFYKVYRLSVHNTANFAMTSPFMLASVIEGEGTIDNIAVKKGDHFLIPAGYGNYTLSGSMELILSGL